MRTTLGFKIIGEEKRIPFDYKKRVSSLFLKIISDIDKDLSDELHDSGEISSYCLSNLFFSSGYKVEKGFGFYIREPNLINLEVSSFDKRIHDALEKSKGSLHSLSIGGSEIYLKIEYVRTNDIHSDLDNYAFSSRDFCQLKKGKNKNTQLSYTPDEFNSSEFKFHFFNNLIRKYENTTNEERPKFDIDSMDLDIVLKGTSLKKLSFSGRITNVKSFNVVVKLDCPIELKKVAYINGIGNYNKNLFGFVNLIK